MKRACWYWTVAVAFGLGVGLFWGGEPREASAQRCACAPTRCESAQRDPRGCCPASACAGGGGGGTKVRRPSTPRCATGQHSSGGHCCAQGEEWVPGRSACVCLDPAGCTASSRTPPSARSSSGGCPAGMVFIPGGTFWMGSPEGQGEADEHPQHRVTLSAYCIDRTEVTVGAYQQCVMAGACPPAPTTVNYSGYSAEEAAFWSQFCNGSRGDRQEHPVNCVDWTQSEAYCRWRGARLPTAAEWEYAARGSDGRTYPWGESAPDHTRLNAIGSEATPGFQQFGGVWASTMYPGNDGFPFTAPVGSYPAGASPYGVLDMAGNVWEWTSDWYGAYPAGDVTDPRGPAAGQYREGRGGGWASGQPAWVRAADRGGRGPAGRDSGQGFRCARGA